MFSGDSYLSVDDKGRLAIPAGYRDGLRESCAARLVLTVKPGSRDCLFLYPQNEWRAVVEQLKDIPNANAQADNFRRIFVGRSKQLEMDRQGRILLPAKHREHAGLTSQVALVGAINKFEIWDKDRWSDHCDTWDDALDMDSLDADSPLGKLSF